MTEAPPPNAPSTPDAADRATPDTTAGTAGKPTTADPASTTTRGPCAFISYSWTSDDHADWIRETAVRLLHDGVQVLLDQFDLAEGQDKYAFMEQAVMGLHAGTPEHTIDVNWHLLWRQTPPGEPPSVARETLRENIDATLAYARGDPP